LFDVFHTIDREKIAKEFSKHQHLLKNKDFFGQINTGREKTRVGIFPEDTKDFLFFLRKEIHLPIQGLRGIPPMEEDPKNHFGQLQNWGKENRVDKLSIGRKGD
jgi:Predicted enzyme with a TIM-barrel fold